MKRAIRGGCFETNSSSQHSIVVTKNDAHIKPEELEPDFNKDDAYSDEWLYVHNGKLWLNNIDEGYGRSPFMILTTFEEKLRYAMCEYLGHLYEDDPQWNIIYGSFKKIVKELVPEFNDFKIDTKDVDLYLDKDGNDILIKDLHYDHWDSEEKHPEYYYIDKDGNKQSAIFNEEEYMEMPNIGMIDHQSSGLLRNFIKDKGISLKEFLTNKKYAIVVDGDEYCDFDRYMRRGFIDKSFITEIYDKSNDSEYLEWLKEEDDEEID